MTNMLPSDSRYGRFPANYTIRPPQEEDVQPIIELIYATEKAEASEATRYLPDAIRSEWEHLDLETDAWCLLSSEGNLAAYGLFFSHDAASYGRLTTDGYVHPDHCGRGLGSMLLDLMEERAAEIAEIQPEGTRLVLVNMINADQATARALLEARGYTLTRVFFNMSIEFDGQPALPTWPEGISVRVCDGSLEALRGAYEMIEEGFQDHFEHTPRTFEEWQQFLVREGFDASLWFLAMDGKRVVGAALCQASEPEANLGWVSRLAVLPAWRKHGLGSALLHHAFGTFYQRGIKCVRLGVDGQSLTGAQHLYERVGMHVILRIGRYEKELRSGRELHPGRIR